ncbi:Crp/Fnr family transcriptional regulator [Thermovibrio sp.]
MELLKEVPLFSNLSDEQLKKISKLLISKRYLKGEVIFSPSERAEFFFILKRGKVKVFKTLNGKEQIIKVFEKPALFGEAASFTGGNFPAWAEAIEDSEVLLILRKDLLNLLREEPELGINLMAVMAQRLFYLTALVESLSLKSALSKLSSYILSKLGDKDEIDFSTGLAAMELGLTKETVSRTLSKLKALGVIEKKKSRVKVKNRKALKDLSG